MMLAELRRMLPTYYQLGLWRSEYIQPYCCVCQVNPSVAIFYAHADTASGLKPKTAWRRPAWLKQASLLCPGCHYQIDWLPPATYLDIPAPPTHPALHATAITAQPSNFPPAAATLSTLSSPSPSGLAAANHLATPKPPSASAKQLSVQAATRYNDIIRSAIIAFKYKEDMTTLPLLVHALRQLPRPHGHHRTNSVLLSVPTTNRRLKKRGFDPVTILSYYLSLHWDISLWNGVSRIDDAVSQQGLSGQERQQNIRNAFQIDALPPKRRIILFDDVVTTGTTLKELAACFNLVTHPLILSACCLAKVDG